MNEVEQLRAEVNEMQGEIKQLRESLAACFQHIEIVAKHSGEMHTATAAVIQKMIAEITETSELRTQFVNELMETHQRETDRLIELQKYQANVLEQLSQLGANNPGA